MFIPMVPTSDIEWRDYVNHAQETLKQDTLALSSGARKSYADLLRGTFSSDDAWFILLDDQLSEIGALTENWDSYGAPVPAPESIESARQAMGKLQFGQLLPEIVAP